MRQTLTPPYQYVLQRQMAANGERELMMNNITDHRLTQSVIKINR